MAERTVIMCGKPIRVFEKPDGKILYNLIDPCAALGETTEWGIEQAEKLGPEYFEKIVTDPNN